MCLRVWLVSRAQLGTPTLSHLLLGNMCNRGLRPFALYTNCFSFVWRRWAPFGNQHWSLFWEGVGGGGDGQTRRRNVGCEALYANQLPTPRKTEERNVERVRGASGMRSAGSPGARHRPARGRSSCSCKSWIPPAPSLRGVGGDRPRVRKRPTDGAHTTHPPPDLPSHLPGPRHQRRRLGRGWAWSWGWDLAPPLAAQRDDVTNAPLHSPGASGSRKNNNKLDSVGGAREVMTSRNGRPPLRADVTPRAPLPARFRRMSARRPGTWAGGWAGRVGRPSGR